MVVRPRFLPGFLQGFLRSVSAIALVAASVSLACAQQTVAPQSNTPVPGPTPEILQKYAPVTAERLKKPEDANWLLFRRTYDGFGFSPLKEITPDNASRLQPVWSMATGQVEGHQAPPIVNNGVMFVATPMGQVIALNAKTGDEYWRYTDPAPFNAEAPRPVAVDPALGDPPLFADIDRLRLVFVDGAFDAAASDPLEAEGIEIAPLSRADAEPGHWVGAAYGVLEAAGDPRREAATGVF